MPWKAKAGFGLLALVLGAMACSSSGASSGCGSSLPDGYPAEERISNAGAVRVTRSGLDFLAQNAGSLAGGLIPGSDAGASGPTMFAIPKSDQTGSTEVANPIPGLPPIKIDYTITICPDGPKPNGNPPDCNVELDMSKAAFKLDALTPNALRIRGDIPVRLRKLPLHVASSVTLDGAIGLGTIGTPECTGTPAVNPVADYKSFPVDIELPLVSETIPPRDGYTKIDVGNAKVSLSVAKEDLAVCATCGAILDTIGACKALVDQAKDSAAKSFSGAALGDLLKEQLKSAVCLKATVGQTPSCPKGTLEKNGVCVFAVDTNVCATTLLGTESRTQIGALTGLNGEGALDLLIASQGQMNPAPGAPVDDAGYEGHTPNGMTLALFGGTKAVAPSKCVPAFTAQLPQNIPVPDELYLNQLTPWTGAKGPDLGIAFAGRFLDYAFGQAYATGALCLGATTEDTDQLKTSLLSIVMPSIKNLTFEQKGAAMAISTRPQAPPRLELGTGADIKADPLIRLKLDRFAIDFYVWMLDRFVRVLTYTADLTLPVNLQTTIDPQKNPKGGIVPVVGDIDAANAVVTGTPLLLEDPTRLSAALTTLVGGLAGQLGGSIAPIDLSSALGSAGIGLQIPEGGIRRLVKDQDAYLGVFANLQLGQAATVQADARANIVERRVDKNGLGLATLTRSTRPSLVLALGSSFDGQRDVEWSWAIDRGARSAWTRDAAPVVQTDELALQGKHVLRVWARVVGMPNTEDTTPVELPFVIDAVPPVVRATVGKPGQLSLEAFDYVSAKDALSARVRLSGATDFGAWTSLAQMESIATGAATEADIEVRDEEENVAAIHLSLIRGRNDPTLGNAATGGCGCDAAGSGSVPPLAIALASTLAVAFALRRRRRWALAAGALTAISAVPACSCGDSAAPLKCGTDCKQACEAPLPYGNIGAYTSVAKTKAGKVWVAGYADAVLAEKATGLYGDLVVGQWDSAKSSIAWEAIDGVPARTDGTCPSNDRQGFRGGETEPGDDVGLWTSIALGDRETPMVAYHDASHRTLKFAYRGQRGWQSYVVYEKARADAGRYAKLVMLENKPAIVFLFVEPGANGKQRSHIMLARASEPVPDAAAKWSFSDVYVDDQTPCWPGTCESGASCLKTDKTCTKTIGGCTPNCAAGAACVSGDGGVATCVDTYVDPIVQTVPDTVGAYLSAAVGPFGLGIVAYDRPRGNLLAFVADQSGVYKPYVLDGESGSRADGTAKDTGDVGLGAALAIGDDGDWHVACVDGTREELVHITARLGMTVVARDVVDDGYSLNGSLFPDGKHIIGDDAVIRVNPGNEIDICYQDATAGTLRCATGGPGRAFIVKALEQPGKTSGFFPRLVPGSREVAFHWRSLDRASQTYSGDVSVVPF